MSVFRSGNTNYGIISGNESHFTIFVDSRLAHYLVHMGTTSSRRVPKTQTDGNTTSTVPTPKPVVHRPAHVANQQVQPQQQHVAANMCSATPSPPEWQASGDMSCMPIAAANLGVTIHNIDEQCQHSNASLARTIL
jgi:hypothetical protein